MNKKIYVKPSMKVFVLEQEPQVLVGSLTGSRNPYAPGEM